MTLLGIEDNNELGNTIEMEFAIYEMIIEIKGGVYTLYARSFSDEYLSLSGFEEKDGIVTKYIQPTFYSDLGGATYTSMPKDIKINGNNIWGLYSDAEYRNECGSQTITGLKKGHNYYFIKLNDKNGTFLKGYKIDFYILDKFDITLYSKTGEKLFETNVWEKDLLDMSTLYANVDASDYIAYNFEPIERDVASVEIQKGASFRVISSDEYNLLKHFTVSYDGVLTKKANHNCDGIDKLTVPAQICGRNIVTIGNGSDRLCDIKNLVISDGIKEIAGFAFSSTLETVSLPDSLTSIETSAFDGCTKLTSIIIPDGVTSLGDFAFRNCTQLTSVTIGNSVTSIGDSAFYGCEKLTSIIIPDNVTSIGSGAFSKCTQLTSVTIGNSITSIERRTFSDCTSLSDLTLPNSVTRIGDYAFETCIALTNITIPNSIISIDSAFYGCTGLTTVNWNATACTSAGSQYNTIFEGCSNLATVNIGDNVKIIPYYAFSYCTGLTSITVAKGNTKYHSAGNCLIETESKTLIAGCKNSIIPTDGSVTSIGGGAFSNCTGLTSVTIPDSVTSIGREAFYGCTGLTSITIPNSVTSIGDWAFSGCTGLTTVNWNATACTSAGSQYNTIFEGCSNLATVNIGDNVKIIPSYAFERCTGLTSITIPDSVTSIGSYAFEGCTGLTNVTIPNSVTSIGGGAFDNTLWYDDQPDGLVFAGKVAYKYKGTMPSNTSILLKEGTLGIADSAFEGCTGLTSITIPNSVTSIGYEAFLGCTGLTSVTIGGSVTSIGSSAFRNCTGLTRVTIPDSVTSIGEHAFQNCTGLTSITIGGSVTSIGSTAFYGCKGLTSITIPNSVTSIDSYAFFYCTGLTSIKFNGTIEQWNAISKGSYWKYNVPATQVGCTDGTVSI